MKSSKGLDTENFGELHTSIVRAGIRSILEMKPGRPKRQSMDRNASPFLPHLAPGTNPLL